jgi:outer membrane murein-binding lipoprotein Lpp
MCSVNANRLVAITTSILLLPPVIANGQNITVPASAATGIALSAASQYRVLSDQRWGDYEDVVLISVLNNYIKLASNGNAKVGSADFSNASNLLHGPLDKYAPSASQFRSQDQAARLRYGIDTLCSNAASLQASQLLLQALFGIEKLKFRQLETEFDPTRQPPADMPTYALTGAALQFIADQVQQASDLAFQNEQFASVVNPILKDMTGFDTTSSYSLISNGFAGLPNLPTPNSDGSYTLVTQTLVGQYTSVVGTFQSAVDVNIAAFKTASGGKPVAPGVAAAARFKLIAFPSTPQAGPDGSNGIGGSDSSKCKPCMDAQLDVTAVSKLVGLSDPGLGSQISTVGTSVITAGNAISGILSATTTGAMLGPMGALVGAGVSIFSSLFGGGGNTIDSQILSQVQKLSNQVASLQKDMDSQFLKVDATLNNIVGTLSQNFAQINYTLGQLSGSEQAIQTGLFDVEAQLNQLALYNSAYHQAEETDTLMSNVNGCIDYRKNHNQSDIGQAPFNICQNAFFTYAQTGASDAIWAPLPPATAYSDDQVYGTISDFQNPHVTGCSGGCPTPFAVLINYLSQYPSLNMHQPPLSAVSPLANPEEWNLGARAYLEMSHEFPRYAANLGTTFFDQMITIGTNVQQAAESINSNRPASGPVTTNQALLVGSAGLTTKYNNFITQNLQSAMQSDLNNYLTDPANNITRANNITLNLWAGGANQHTSWRPSLGTISLCAGGSVGAAPSNLLAQVPDLYAFSQSYLGSGQLSMCVTNVQWINVGALQAANTGIVGNGSQVYPGYAIGQYCSPQLSATIATLSAASGTLVASISISFNGTVLFSATVSTPAVEEIQGSWLVMCLSGGIIPAPTSIPFDFHFDANAMLLQNWTVGVNMQSLFNTAAQLAQQPQPQLLGSIAAQLDSLAAGHQHNIYGIIAKDFSNAGSAVQNAGTLLDGAGLLLQAYANLGLPNSLQFDTALHSSLYGSKAISNSSEVNSDFSGFSTASISDTTDNKITDEVANLNARAAALTTAMTAALNRIDQDQLPESLSQIDITLEDLQAFEGLQKAAITAKDVGILSPCNDPLPESTSVVSPSGGNITFTIKAPAGCPWMANAGSSWLSLSSGQTGTGTGPGSVTVSASANTSGSVRTGTLTAGDQVYIVFQAAATSSSN